MSAQALDHQLQNYFGSDNPLVVYFDFHESNVFAIQSGSIHQAYLKNSYPSSISGKFDGKIIGASGSTANQALNLATGLNGFISNDEGNFTKNYIEISGSPLIPIKDCSYLFSIEPDLSKNGILFGSFQNFTETIGGIQFSYPKGFNFGLTDRGKLFLHSSSRDGEYCFVANNIELSQKNVVGLSFSNSSCQIFRFDYLNDEFESQEFTIDASTIQNNNIYLGSSFEYFRNTGQRLYSGIMDEFAIFSGQIPGSYLFEISKSFIGQYYSNPGLVTEADVLSGYIPTYIYKTGVTGTQLNITGYSNIQSGIDTWKLVETSTQNFVTGEGGRYLKSRDLSGVSVSYLEEIGYLSTGDLYALNYNPTGEAAFDTLGLQNITQTVTGSQYQWVQEFVTVQVPLYQTVNLTGTTNEISGVINTPVYVKQYVTGAGESGVSISLDSIKLQKDYIYFMGQR